MAETFTDDGVEWISQKSVDDSVTSVIHTIAVGTGTSSPIGSDETMESEVYRTNRENANCTVDVTSNLGEVRATITISGGTEVPDGTTITEFGVFIDDEDETMIYREVTSGRTITSGDRVTFELIYNVVDN